jgi:hypothetical protein
MRNTVNSLPVTTNRPDFPAEITGCSDLIPAVASASAVAVSGTNSVGITVAYVPSELPRPEAEEVRNQIAIIKKLNQKLKNRW